MKNFVDYCNAYEKQVQALKEQDSSQKNFTRRCIWILCEWEKDNQLNSTEIDKYVQAMVETSKRDEVLYSELVLAHRTIAKLDQVVNQDIKGNIHE